MRRDVPQRNHTLQLADCISASPGCKEHHLLIKQRRSIGVVLVRELRQDSKAEEQHAWPLPLIAVTITVVVTGGGREGSSEHEAGGDTGL